MTIRGTQVSQNDQGPPESPGPQDPQGRGQGFGGPAGANQDPSSQDPRQGWGGAGYSGSGSAASGGYYQGQAPDAQQGYPQPGYSQRGFGQGGYSQGGYSQSGDDQPGQGHDAYGAGAAGAGGYGGGAYGPGGPAGPGGPGESGGGPSKGLIFGIIGGVALLLIGGIVALVFLLGGNGGSEADEEGSDNGGSEEGAEGENEADVDPDADETPHGVVEAYLTALSQGDAETAISFMEGPADTTYMTDEVVAYSNENHPMADIEVEEANESGGEYSSYGEVSADFTIDGEPESITFWVSGDEEAGFVVESEIELDVPADAANFTPTVNGVAFEESGSTFGGIFVDIDLEEEYYSFGSDGSFLAEDYGSTGYLALELSTEGHERWRELVMADIDECVASSELDGGCGLELPDTIDGEDLVPDGVTRSISGNTQRELDNLEASPDYNDPRFVSTYISGSVDTDVELENDPGQLHEVIIGDGLYFGEPVVDMTQEDPTVEWE